MFKKIGIILLLNMGAVNHGWADETQQFGRVHMMGSIVDTACAIDINSSDQTIDMGVVPIGQIVKDGRGEKKSFSIRLVRCILDKSSNELTRRQQFTITFDGSDDEGLFGVDGVAKGVAMKITDNDGNIATPGTPLPPGNVTSGNMSLDYSLQLVANNKSLHAGEFSSIIKFKMDYY